MATVTKYFYYTTGSNVYAKLLEPLTASPWSTGTTNASPLGSGWYTVEVDDSKHYGLYKRVGAEPASSDGPPFRMLGSDAGVTVVPLTGVVESRVQGTTITLFTAETTTVSIAVVDAQGEDVDLTGMTLSIVFEDQYKTDVATIANGSITRSGSTISFAIPSSVTATSRVLNWSLRNSTALLLHGIVSVEYGASVDA